MQKGMQGGMKRSVQQKFGQGGGKFGMVKRVIGQKPTQALGLAKQLKFPQQFAQGAAKKGMFNRRGQGSVNKGVIQSDEGDQSGKGDGARRSGGGAWSLHREGAKSRPEVWFYNLR